MHSFQLNMIRQERSNPDIVTEQETVAALHSEDDASVEAFVRSNMSWMLQAADRILKDRSAAEDSVQAAFMGIFKGLRNFRGDSSLRTWMRRIVINEALGILRKQERLRETSIDELLPSFDDDGCRIEERWQFRDTPESLAASAQVTDKVLAAIDQLPDGYRVVLLLRDIEEYSTAEAAAALGLEESNVKVRLHRARAALKKLLEPVFKEEGLT